MVLFLLAAENDPQRVMAIPDLMEDARMRPALLGFAIGLSPIADPHGAGVVASRRLEKPYLSSDNDHIGSWHRYFLFYYHWMSERNLPSSELFSPVAQRMPCIILCAFAIGSTQAENYQNTVVGLNPTYYYELNETDTDGGAADTMGNAPAPGVFNGNYNGGLPMAGVALSRSLAGSLCPAWAVRRT